MGGKRIGFRRQWYTKGQVLDESGIQKHRYQTRVIYTRIGFLCLEPFGNEGHIFSTDAAYSPRIVIWRDLTRSGQRGPKVWGRRLRSGWAHGGHEDRPGTRVVYKRIGFK